MLLPIALLIGLQVTSPQDVNHSKDTAGTSGIGLYTSCRFAGQDEQTLSEDDHTRLTTCLSYTMGVMIGYHLGNGKDCFPKYVLNTQVALIVYKYLENHPELLDRNSAVLTIKALQAAYPCAKP